MTAAEPSNLPDSQDGDRLSDVAGEPPLVVDFDGTLIETDLLWESVAVLLGERPLVLFNLPFWLVEERARLKHRRRRLGRRHRFSPPDSPTL